MKAAGTARTARLSFGKATKDTSKGGYGKIKHASALLACVQPQTVATRCASFRHFTEWLDAAIASSVR